MKKIFSIFLCFLMLISSSGVAMTTHYCGGYAMAMEIALGHAHLDCGMEDMDVSQCPGENHNSTIKEQNCCEDISLSPETDNHNVQLSNNLNLDFVVAFVVTNLELFRAEFKNQTRYTHYSPPLLKQDIPILHQSFLL